MEIDQSHYQSSQQTGVRSGPEASGCDCLGHPEHVAGRAKRSWIESITRETRVEDVYCALRGLVLRDSRLLPLLLRTSLLLA